MLARDHYATLGVPPDADNAEVERAYLHLSRRYHPDVNPGDPHAAAVFERIESAYQVLADPERRARYDREDAGDRRGDASASELSVRLLPESDTRSSYDELFERLREQSRRLGESHGEDVYAVVDVPLAQAERGRRATVRVQRHQPCAECGARGRVRLQQTRPCERCAGSGEETFVKGALSVTCPCGDCSGSGLVSGLPCPVCDGGGRVPGEDTLLVRVPPGVRDGQEVRIGGGGHAGKHGGPAGDLVVRCQVESIPGVRREGPHLMVTLAIGVAEAVLGARLRVATLYGSPAPLRIPPNTQAGSVFRLRGRGLELPDGRRGDMLVRVEITIPEVIDEDAKELIRRFAALHPHDPRGVRGTRR